MTLLQQANDPDVFVSMCNYCVPIQSCHYAVIDISEFTPQLTYEIGMLHSLGVPTLILSNTQASSGVLSDSQIAFEGATDLVTQVEKWLSSYQA